MSVKSRSTTLSGHATVGILLVILLLASGLRFYRLGVPSLWNDEGTSVAVAQRDLGAIARDAAQDIHPPLYYWLLSGWVGLFGTSEVAVRSLSALLGVMLVAITYALGRQLGGRGMGLAGALLAAINPFQIYYSQEARMYMLAAVLAAGAILALASWVRHESWAVLAALVILELAGLYTHYSFLFVLAVLNLALLVWLWSHRRDGTVSRRLGIWAASQAVVVVLYLPWLPVAVRQVTRWPSPAQTPALVPALAEVWRWLVLGPTIETAQVAIPLVLAALVAAAGGLFLAVNRFGQRTVPGAWSAALLGVWLGLPVAAILSLGLYREAYLKFLLVTAPAVSLLLASGFLAPPFSHTAAQRYSEHALRRTRQTYGVARLAWHFFQVASALALLDATGLALQNYYAHPAYARDDYRAIAAYIDAVGRPGDTILLNAPGQQEVFGYYYQGKLSVHPLPESRPLDPAATEAALAELARPGGRVFAVLWATDESDPERTIEGWLDTHAYKAFDSWYGNVRLAVYGVPEHTPATPDRPVGIPLQNAETGDEIVLLGFSLLHDRLAAGDIAQLTLFWQAAQTPVRRYKAFVHALDNNNLIAGQRDAEPGGGARLTTLWTPGEAVADNHGLPIHPATPPGDYRVEVGLYDAETGKRLTTPEGTGQIWLDPLTVERPSAPAPIAALGIQHTAGAQFGPLALLGYDAYELGFAPSAPSGTGLAAQRQPKPGAPLQVVLYWRAEARPAGNWRVALSLVGPDGQEWARVTDDLVSGYPTGQWQTGDVWRGQFVLPIPADAPAGSYRLRVQALAPDGSSPGPFLSRPMLVGP